MELSAATFANWVSKTANLLVDGLGLGPGSRASVDLPLHWQSLVVTAACWAAGLTVQFGSDSAEVGFAAEGQPAPAADEVVLLSLRPLGAGLAEPADGAVDYAEVRTYGDRFGSPPPAPSDIAIPGRTHADLATAAAAAAGVGRRILLAPAGDPALDEALVVSAYLGVLDRGSAVLCRHADPALLDRRLQAERAEFL